MPPDFDIVCFSNDWGGDPLSKTHLMRLATRNHRVLWVESLGNRAPRASGRDLARIGRRLAKVTAGVREVEPNLFVLSPFALPVYGSRLAQAANATLLSAQVRLAMARLGMERPVVISYLPAAAPVVDRLGASLVVYHCVDEFSEFKGAGNAIATLERQLVARSDLVVCASQPLLEAKRPLHPSVHLLRHGVDHRHFAQSVRPELAVHPLVRDLPKPVLAFVGLIAEWVDQELLAAVADHFAHGTLLVVGHANVEAKVLSRRKNVVFTGRRPYTELPSILRGVDVSLVAFRENELARNSNPLKAREYLAAGLPVVSTPIPEIERLGLCHIASGPRDFIAAIEGALAAGAGPSELRSAAIRHESWESRWTELEALIRESLRPSARSAG